MPLRLLLASLLLASGAGVVGAADAPRIVDVEIGLGGGYKLGSWAPLRVSVDGGAEPQAVSVVAIAPDPDGVGVATRPPAGRPLAAEPGRVGEAVLYTRVGKQYAPIEVRLYVGPKQVDRRVVQVGDPTAADSIEIGEPAFATQRLVGEIGPASGVVEWARNETDPDYANYDGHGGPAVARVDDAGDLPRDARGYDSFDAIVLNARRADWLTGLSPEDPRVAALRDWVRGGGNLVISCGAAGADVLGPDGPLEGVVPGEFDKLAVLPRAAGLERYVERGDDTPVELRGGELQVSRLRNVVGVIEAYDGRDPEALPLVVRSPLGFGEVTFAAFDLDHPALVAWPDRAWLVGRLLGPRFAPLGEGSTPPSWAYANDGNDDVGALLRRLDRAFTGVGDTPFLVVVALVIGYLLLIGPGDYFFVKRVIGRMEATWVTFPLIVILTSAGAYAAARWLKGDDLLVNQVEILDVDTTEGRIRGALVTHLFSPIADRYQLGLAARGVAGDQAKPDERVTAWLGKPGYGLGSMNAASPTRAGWRPDYAIDPTPLLGPSSATSIDGMPVQVWSTKTLVSVWAADGGPWINADVSRNADGLAEGRLTNDSGCELLDCQLLYGDWALRLGDLADGETADVVSSGPSLLRLQTVLARAGGDDDSIGALTRSLAANGRADSAGVRRATALADCDLTHHLDAGRALLLARLEGPRSELLRNGEPLVEDPAKRRSWVEARFILRVRDDR